MAAYRQIIQRWKNQNIVTVDDLDTVLSNFRVVFAYNSGAIENQEITYHNTRELFENRKLSNFTGDLRTIFEMENQRKCYDYLKGKIVEKHPISVEFIREIHQKLTEGTYDQVRWDKGERPGEFKHHDYVVGDGQGAPPEDVEVEIKELCEEITDIPDKGENIIKTAAYLHCKFENIHAFADGNGRVGRTLMNYFLMTHEYPPIVVYNDSKDRYYRALEDYDKTGKIDMFTDYMKKSLEKTWEVNRAPEQCLNNILER